MEIRYYVKYLGVWFGIYGSNEDPEVIILGKTLTNVSPEMIRKFNKILGDEKIAIEEAHTSTAAHVNS